VGIVLGIDVGGSTTKIVGFSGGELLGTLQVRAADQITSLFGAIGNFLRERGAALGGVERIVLTGVGASYIDEPIYGIETRKVDEFLAIGHGALYLTGLREALVLSLGTGTAVVRAGAEGITHIGGSGVGGGTILGLASRMLNKSDIDAVIDLAESGRLENVDLSVSDILGGNIPSLPPDLTAANFGKIKSAASEADLALGILNMVLQTAGTLAVFAARNDTIRDIVMIGMLSIFPQAHKMQETFRSLYGLNFIIPPHSVFATAIGAGHFSFEEEK